MQSSLSQAHEQGALQLDRWAQTMIQRIRMNFAIQKVYPEGHPGPYKYYYIINAARSKKRRSTGSAYTTQNLYAKVHNGAGGNTELITFFFRQYLLFVDWGVGQGQTISEVPEHGVPKMRRRYANWQQTGDRQRRPLVLGAVAGSRFFLANLLQKYWGRESELAILFGLGEDNE